MDLGKEHILWKLKKVTWYPEVGCWLIGTGGYQKLRIAGRQYTIHRLSAYLFLDLDIENQTIQVNHKVECLNPNCWNPEHLYLGNQSDNIKDQVVKGTHHNASKEYCIRGHKFDQFKYENGKIIGRRCSQCRRVTG